MPALISKHQGGLSAGSATVNRYTASSLERILCMDESKDSLETEIIRNADTVHATRYEKNPGEGVSFQLIGLARLQALVLKKARDRTC